MSRETVKRPSDPPAISIAVLVFFLLGLALLAAFYQREKLEPLLTELVRFSSQEAIEDFPQAVAPVEEVDYTKLIAAAQEKWGYRVPGGTAEADFQISNINNYKNSRFIDVESFGAVLLNGDYRAAEAIFVERERLLEKKDFASETNYSDFIVDIDGREGVSLRSLDEWIASTGSEYAYVSRASYYSSAAWHARGNDFIKDTEDYKIHKFRILSELAVADALAALDINSESYSAYRVLITLVNTSSLPMSESQLAKKVDELFPWSVNMRRSFVYALYPQWGGSYREMDAYGKHVAKYNDINPQLWALQGEGMALRGYDAHKKERFKECVSNYSDALAFGIHSSWLRMRADCLEHLGEYQLALRDIDQALSINKHHLSMRVKNKILENL